MQLLEPGLFWDTRYKEGQTGWDLGKVSPPLAKFLDGLQDPHISILIPGAGNAYEAYYLQKKGFDNITVLDIAPSLIARHQEYIKQHRIKGIKFIEADFFSHSGQYDLIIEQTFFCAILPEQRNDYVRTMHSLLNADGLLAGLLFNCHFEHQGPPFGGDIIEYRERFSHFFKINLMAPCYNSMDARVGRELFFIVTPKKPIL